MVAEFGEFTLRCPLKIARAIYSSSMEKSMLARRSAGGVRSDQTMPSRPLPLREVSDVVSCFGPALIHGNTIEGIDEDWR
jgi:hypothetical protein